MIPLTDVAFITGFRKSELLSLTWGQVDFEHGRISLRALDTKARTARFFPLTAELRTILEDWRIETEKLERLKLIKVLYVFHCDGQQIRSFSREWRAACKAAGYVGKLVHDFRRTAVRNFVRKGISEQVWMLLSGHKTRSVFQRYNVTNEEDILNAGKLLEGGKNYNYATNSMQVIEKKG